MNEELLARVLFMAQDTGMIGQVRDYLLKYRSASDITVVTRAMEDRIDQTGIRRYMPAEITREEGGDRPVINGYPILYNSRSDKLYGYFFEEIVGGAFDEAVQEDDVRALFNHDPSFIFGRNIAKTLTLESDSRGVKMRAEVPDYYWTSYMISAIERGDVTGFSFQFRPTKNEWVTLRDGDEVEYLHRVIKSNLYDVSPVTYPAYPQTRIDIRSLASEILGENENNGSDQEPNFRKMRHRLDLLSLGH
jgi:HK97 family phage prohead protease